VIVMSTSKVIFVSSFLCFVAAAAFLPAAGCADKGGLVVGDDPSMRLGSVQQALDGGDDAEAGSANDAGPGVPPKRGEIVISAVYGGGGGTGATFRNDYVEIFNRTRTTISLDGTSLQYAPGGSDFGGAGNTHNLSGTIPAGGYFLVALAGNGAEGATLPTPDSIGTVVLGLNDGKVALALTTASLACGAVALCGTKPLDMVGYGATTDWEGSGATGGQKVAALDAAKGAVRKAGGCTDTDNNGADFTVGAPPPAPKNSATALAPCPLPPRPDASTPVPPPPVVDPPLGNEDPFDAGSRRDAGANRPGAGAEDECTVSAPGHSTSSSHDLAAVGALAALTIILSARRRRAS
jgi:hypothetical protein